MTREIPVVLDLFHHMFGVVGGRYLEKNGKRQFQQNPNIQGTAFAIGPDTFLTAGHVIEQLRDVDIALTYRVDDALALALVTDYEIHKSADIAVVKATGIPLIGAFPWQEDELPRLQDVMTCGYPYAFDPDTGIVDVRAFKGHIVTPMKYRNIVSRPSAYEVSFLCPRGLSGAPLILPSQGKQAASICGVVIANHRTEMCVFTDAEIEDDGTEKTRFERYEAVNYGVCIASDCILALESKLLGCTIRDFVGRH